MAKIFISYRRSDTGPYADQLVERLNAFQFDSVFLDREGISLGSDFPDEIRRALAQCNVVLVLIGPSWIDATDVTGRRRLDDPSDWVRREIELASELNKHIVPVYFDGARQPEATELQNAIRFVRWRNGYKIDGNYFLRDADHLCGQLDLLNIPAGKSHGKVSRAMLHVGLIAGLLFIVTVGSAIAPTRFPALPETFWVLPGSMLFTAFAFLITVSRISPSLRESRRNCRSPLS